MRERRIRERHGRGARGPAVVPLRPGYSGLPRRRTQRERFDEMVLAIVTEIDERWQDRLGLVEYAVEDVPVLPEDWDERSVPLASLVRGSRTTPTRLVLFRRPLELRAPTRADLEALVLTVVVEQVADLLNVSPSVIDERYDES